MDRIFYSVLKKDSGFQHCSELVKYDAFNIEYYSKTLHINLYGEMPVFRELFELPEFSVQITI